MVYEALEHRAAADLGKVSIDTAVDRGRIVRLGYALAGIVAICASMWPSHRIRWYRWRGWVLAWSNLAARRG